MKSTHRERITWIFIFVGLTFLLRFYIGLFRNALIDDAFITFQYARNLRDHQTWGFFPGTTTHTATSPLNVILTALMGLVFSDLVEAAIWLAVLEALALCGVLLLISKELFRDFRFGFLGAIVTLGNPFLVSTFGLETLLYMLIVVVCLYLYLIKRIEILAITVALLTLTRPDGILLFVILFCSGGDQGNKVPWRGKFLAIYFISLLPWYLFSWIHLGSLLPDTFLLKVNQNWQGLHYVYGLGLYLYKYPLLTIFSFAWVPFGILFIFSQEIGEKSNFYGNFSPVSSRYWKSSTSFLRNIEVILLFLYNRKKQTPKMFRILFGFGAAYFIAYAILKVPPYHWYYTPVAVTLNLVGVGGITEKISSPRESPKAPSITTLGILAAFASLGMLIFFIQNQSLVPDEPPIHTNWATQHQYQEIGLWLRENMNFADKIKLNGEIGTLAYYSQRNLLDMFSCRYEQQLSVNRLLQRGGLVSLLAQINFHWFDPGEPCWPPDYLLAFARFF